MARVRLLVACGFVGVLAGCGSPTAPRYVQPVTFVGPTRIAGGNPTQRRLAREVVRWMGEGTIRTVSFGRGRLEPVHQRGVVLTASIAGFGNCHPPAAGLYEWEEQLFIETYLSLAAHHPAGSVASAETDCDGGVTQGFSDDTNSRQAARPRLTADRRAIERAAASTGGQDVSVHVIATPVPALAIRFRVSNPARFLVDRATTFLAAVRALPLFGYWVGVEDPGGEIVWSTFRLPDEGGDFAVRSLAKCNPIQNGFGEPAGPPCPAR